MNFGWVALGMLLVHGAATQNSAPKPPRASAPKAIAADRPTSAVPERYAREPFVIERYRTTVRYEKDGTGEKVISATIRIQNEIGAQRFSELVFPYTTPFERIDLHFVRVRKSDGTVAEVGADSVKDVAAAGVQDAPAYSGFREKRVGISSLSPSDTLEYEAVTRYDTAISPGNFWFDLNFQSDAIVLDERLDVNLPSGLMVNVKSPAARDSVTRIPGSDRILHSWKHSNLVTAPEPQDSEDQLLRRATQPPDVEISTFGNWQSLGQWLAKFEQLSASPSPELESKAAALTRESKSDIEKIDALYTYVSQSIPSVDIASTGSLYPPLPVATVFNNHYADSQDKARLLIAMLLSAGIRANLCLLPSARKFDETFPSPSRLDRALVAVQLRNDFLWLDPTPEVAPFRFLPAALRAKLALALSSENPARILKTPADPPFQSIQRAEIDGRISDLGKLSARVHYSLRGDTEFLLRVAFHRTPQDQWKQLAQTILNFDGIHGEVLSVKPADAAATKIPFELDIEFSQADFMDWSAARQSIGIPLGSVGLPDPPDDSEPVELGSPLDVTTTIRLQWPERFDAQPPVATEVDRDYATFKSSYHFADHVLTAERSLSFKARELPASRVADYAAFSRAVQRDEIQKLGLTSATPASSVVLSSASEGDLLDAGTALLHDGNARAAEPLLQRVVELEPQHKEGWEDLGLAYSRLGQLDDAADSFRKQIAIDPRSEHAYDYLGMTLEQQQKPDQAAEVFREQLDVNPLDATALAALGSILFEQHRFADSAAEFEKAAILSPKNMQLQLSLGEAYINDGQTAPALASFEKAVAMSHSAQLWNAAASALADHKVGLDQARTYVESAISLTTETLRNVELSKLDGDSLRQVDALGIYWDTMGWVRFQQGDLDSAEHFLRAAWQLDERGDAAFHLGRLIEQRGNKQQATHMYALALASPHPNSEARARLTLLLGGNAGIDELVNAATPELAALRTLPAGKLLPEDAKADFLIVLAERQGTGHVEAAKFMGGSDKLKLIGDKLRALDYRTPFPDSSAAKLIRRGSLTCVAVSGECTLTLDLPENAAAPTQ